MDSIPFGFVGLLVYECAIERHQALRPLQKRAVGLERLVEVGLVDDLPRGVHIEHRYAAVDDVHAIFRQDVGDGAAASNIDLAQFSCLKCGITLLHDGTNAGHVFGIGIVGSAFAAAAGELVEHHTATEIRCVLRLERACVGRIEACRHVAGKHAGVCQAAAQRQIARLSCKVHDFGDGVLEEHGGHTRGADTANLLFVNEDAHARLLQVACFELGDQAGVGAYAVVVAVADHHGFVEAAVACGACGNHFEFAREEVSLRHIVFFGEDGQQQRLDGFFFRQLIQLVGLGAGCPLMRVGGFCWPASNEDIEVFAFDHFGRLFLQLVLSEVHQQIGDAEHGVAFVFAHVHLDDAAVFLGDYAMDGQGKRDPLVFLDAAVIMRVKQRESARFIQRVLLDVQAGAVNVGAEDIEALLHGAAADLCQDDRLAETVGVHFIACFEHGACRSRFVDGDIACRAGHGHGRGCAFAFGLVFGDERLVIGGEGLDFRKVGFVVGKPRVSMFHDASFSRLDPGAPLRRAVALGRDC